MAAARALGAGGLEGDAVRALQSLEAAALRGPTGPASPVDQADLEDRLTAWLDEHGVDPDLAYPLAEHGLTVADLEATAPALDSAQLGAVLRYVATDATARALANSISSAAARIHSLVAAVKKHTHMDRAPTVEEIVLADHIADAVALMRAKAQQKGVSVEIDVEADVPAVAGSVADLNQVWMHLVDNAIDAATESVRISVESGRAEDVVVVRVVDDGAGIPAADHERVFEPFFTTKEVGQGRGLGLDVARAVVVGHRGTVDLSCGPGRTEFRVTLPVAGGAA